MPPVISLTMMSVEKGVFAAAAKKPAMPTMTKLARVAQEPGHQWWKTIPSAPPPQPPMTIEGPKTPPEPPLPMVKLVVAILPSAIVINSTPSPPRRPHHSRRRPRTLNSRIAEGQHCQHLRVPMQQEEKYHAQESRKEGADGWMKMPGERQSSKARLQP